MQIRDRQAKEKYEYEKQLASVIRENEQEHRPEYKQTIIELTPEEVFFLASMEDDAAMRKLEEISSNDIQKNREQMEVEKSKFEQSIRLKSEEKEKSRIDIAEFSTSAEAEIYTGLRHIGYENGKIKLLLQLAKPPVSYTLDDILKLFSTDMDIEEMEQICSILMQTKTKETADVG